MAAYSNRSPSPISNRPNPNLRTSETSSKIRRSFSGNPFTRPSMLTNPKSFNPITPANSPSDFGQRHTTGKEGFVVTPDFEEKENDKDPNSKPLKVRSPAVVKGSKNFMSPTISAASKFTPSPRKKVLTERNNDPVRTSVSFDGKIPFSTLVNRLDVSEDSESKPEMGFNYKKVETPSCDSTFPDLDCKKEEAVLGPHSTSKAPEKDAFFSSQVPSSSLKVSDSLSETITVESECVSVDTTSKFKPSFSSVSPIIAPLDADPSVPPYDPKTNYLSPRPQFLHYKPNPRTELYLNNEKGLNFGDGKRLEDSFMSENFSDTEVTEESQSEDSLKESEDDSSAEILTEEEEEEEPHVAEPMPISTSNSTHLSEDTVEANRVPRPKFFTRSKSVSLLLVLLIVCLSISLTDSPVIGPSVFNDLSFSVSYDPSEIVVFAKAIFDGFVRNVKHWSANCISHLSRLIHTLDGVDKLGPLRFSNLTDLQEDRLAVDGYFKIDLIEDKSEESYEQDDLELAPEGEVEMELLEEKGQPEVEADDEISEEASQGHIDTEIEDKHLILQAEVMEADSSQEIQNQDQSDSAFHINSEIEDKHLILQAEVMEADSSQEIQNQYQSDSAFHINSEPPQINEVFEDQLSEIEAFEIKHDVVITGEVKGDSDIDLGSTIESTTPDANPEFSSDSDPSFRGVQSLDTLSTSLHGSEDKLPLHERISLLVLALALVLVASIAVIYFKQRKTTSPNVVVHVDPLLTKKLISSSISPSNEHTYQHKADSHNWATEVDVAGESCPSEMSSLQTYSKKVLNGTNEAQSQEMRLRKTYRRESLASSSSDYSMASSSYGSFTTYEKISSKNQGFGDEETVTPVRRSSRIRNHQVTSP